MKTKNSCYTYFRITGTFEPDDISKALKLEPYETFKIGELRKNGKTRYDFSSWSFGKCDIYDVIVENQMLTTIKPLLGKINLLNELREKYNLSFYLEVVPSITPKEAAPCLAPSLEVMQFCCDTQTKIDIDFSFVE